MPESKTNRLTTTSATRFQGDISSVPGPVSETYLQDESKMRGAADRLFFPETEAELAEIVRRAAESKTPVTFSGARTGITGGAVPRGGWMVSFEKLAGFYGMRYDAEQDAFFLTCGPGTTLETIQSALENPDDIAGDDWSGVSLEVFERFKSAGQWFFPPDPTERSASLGGMTACNASGARSFFYGPTRGYISGLRVVLAGGLILDIPRGRFFADKQGDFSLALPDGSVRGGRLPSYKMPAIKNTAGYFVKPGMDLIDLFIGSEGTLGVFSQIEIRLVRVPESIISVIAFFNNEQDAFQFVHAARADNARNQSLPLLPCRPLSLEYFDGNSLNLLREQKEKIGESSGIPALAPEWRAAVSIEFTDTEERIEDDAAALLELLEACGSDSNAAWTAFDEQETKRLKTFRHALPEAVNQRIGERAARYPGLSKLGTDIVVPDDCLDEMMFNYRTALDEAGLEYVIFGHIGDNHTHVNILPRNLEEYNQGKKIYADLAGKAVALGGSVAGEHGIGKLKKNMLLIMYGSAAVEEMLNIKRVFDPDYIFNRENVFDAP